MTETKAEQDVNWAELRPQLIKIGLEIGLGGAGGGGGGGL